MAKWGEGDPRWIVEERPDATNVNNWHWTERNASVWSQERLKNLFEGLVVPSDVADLKIKDIDKLEGDASANNRKGKLIFFYEWNLVLNWVGTLKNGTGESHSGKITIPNLSEENEISEVDIQVTVKDDDGDGDKLKQIMHTKGKDVIREKLNDYVVSLKKEFAKGMILPKKDAVIKPDAVNNLTSGFNKKVNMQPVTTKVNIVSPGTRIDTTTLKLTQQFQCRAQEFYDAMTRIELVMAFTRGPVKIDPVVGGEFELFGGNISGSFVELVPGKRIVQKWRYKQWPSGHYSMVNLDIAEKSDHTEVSVIQTGVPKSDAEVTQGNWERYYWNSIKQTFGFGTFLP